MEVAVVGVGTRGEIERRYERKQNTVEHDGMTAKLHGSNVLDTPQNKQRDQIHHIHCNDFQSNVIF
jgi:hypothetical protein